MDENLGPDQLQSSVFYEIRLKGHLDEYWSEWLGGLTVTYDEQDNTLLAGPVVDQAELHGLLKKVRDLGLPLISVNPVQADSAEMS